MGRAPSGSMPSGTNSSGSSGVNRSTTGEGGPGAVTGNHSGGR
jgi:hypothetical protein